MTLLVPRTTYKPFLYERAFDLWMSQQNAHWIFTEVPMSSDIQDWKLYLTEEEKQVVGGTLKGFIQAEVVVNDYWTTKVKQWFQHPEIAAMASTFGAWETIHTFGYAYLNDSLGLLDYDAFLNEPTAKAKIDRLTELTKTEDNDPKTIARSLAIFSGFTEGVSLFSSFAILLNFSRFNKLKGVGQIISWSIKDESLHSEAGCWLFRQLIKENPEIWTDELKKDIYEAARTTVALEDDFIDKVFEKATVEGLEARDLKQFIRNRANVKLGDLGLKTNWKNVDQESLERMKWFDYLSSGTSKTDFFSQRETDYSKGTINWDLAFVDDKTSDEKEEQQQS